MAYKGTKSFCKLSGMG